AEGRASQLGLEGVGGGEHHAIYRGGGFERGEGGDQTNDPQETSPRANLHNQISRLMDLSISTGYTSSDVNLPQNDNNNQGILSSGLLGFAFDTVAPLAGVFNPNGGYRFLNPAQATQVFAGLRIEHFTGGATLN